VLGRSGDSVGGGTIRFTSAVFKDARQSEPIGKLQVELSDAGWSITDQRAQLLATTTAPSRRVTDEKDRVTAISTPFLSQIQGMAQFVHNN
jgi:hypothetical protein